MELVVDIVGRLSRCPVDPVAMDIIADIRWRRLSNVGVIAAAIDILVGVLKWGSHACRIGFGCRIGKILDIELLTVIAIEEQSC